MNRFALILATDVYEDASIQPLRFAERDGRLVGSFLRERAGFQRIQELYGHQFTKHDALRSAERLARELSGLGGGSCWSSTPDTATARSRGSIGCLLPSGLRTSPAGTSGTR